MTRINTSFTRYRLGVNAGTTVSPALLDIFGSPLNRGEYLMVPFQFLPATASIICAASWATKVGDTFVATTGFASGRLFQVVQIRPEPGKRVKLMCAEYIAIAPDEFEHGLLSAFWTNTPGFVVGAGTDYLYIVCGGATMQAANFMYQTAAGDFDVWIKLGVAAPSSGLLGTCRFGIGARVDASNQIYISVDSVNQGSPSAVVSSTRNAGSNTESSTAVSGVIYLRLKRVGTQFLSYYSTLTTDPTTESDWTLHTTTSAIQSTSDVQLGIAGWITAGLYNAFQIFFFRMWTKS